MNTVLFDLDGTLLPCKWEIFEREYFKRLTYKLKDLFTPDQTIKYIWKGTMEMILNLEPDKTNEQVFMEKFCSISKTDSKMMQDLFNDFYRNEYKTIGNFFTPSEYMVKSVEILKKKGYSMVVATNPLFPMEALIERIKWAGLNEKDFILVTSFENMHYCKPQIKYYEEILQIIGKKAEECIMVGNDVDEDIIAGKVGIKTYLIENYMINKSNKLPEPDFRGKYEDFYLFVKNLPYALREDVAVG